MSIYLAPWVLSGLGADAGELIFRPRASSDLGNWSCIDLRPDPTKIDGFCLLHSNEPVTDPIVLAGLLGDSAKERLAASARLALESRLVSSIAAAGLGAAIGELLLPPGLGGHGDGARWKPAREGWRDFKDAGGVLRQPHSERAVQIWLGGELMHEAGVRAATHNTEIINDDFTAGASSGDDLPGNAPDTTNTPGNSWGGPRTGSSSTGPARSSPTRLTIARASTPASPTCG